MAIEPIAIPGLSRNQAGVESILERGTSALGSILRDSIQIGRDQANNQRQAERDFLTEQRREINLTDRKVARAQSQENLDRTFEEDSRRFDVKFGQDERRFDFTREQADVNNMQQDRQIDISERNATVNEEVARGNLDERRESNDLRREDITLRREERKEDKGQRGELYKLNLETALIEKQNAIKNGSSAEQKAAADRKVAESRGEALARLEELGQTDMEAAKTFYRTTILGAGFDTKVVGELGARYGEPKATSASTGAAKDPAEMDADEVTRELAVVQGATWERTGSAQGPAKENSEKHALRISALKRRKEELEKQTPAGRTSIADRLRGLDGATR